jgi:hypothetical protein
MMCPALLTWQHDRWPRWSPRSNSRYGCDFASRCNKGILWSVGSIDRHLTQLFHSWHQRTLQASTGCCRSAVTRVIASSFGFATAVSFQRWARLRPAERTAKARGEAFRTPEWYGSAADVPCRSWARHRSMCAARVHSIAFRAVGTPITERPRTDPCERDSRARLLPRVFDAKPPAWCANLIQHRGPLPCGRSCPPRAAIGADAVGHPASECIVAEMEARDRFHRGPVAGLEQ